MIDPGNVSFLFSISLIITSLNFIETDGDARALAENLSRILNASGSFCANDFRDKRRRSEKVI
jgi:hypothetical protein